MKRVPNKPTGMEALVDALKKLVDKSKDVIAGSIKGVLSDPPNNKFNPKRRSFLKKTAIGVGGAAIGLTAYWLATQDGKESQEGVEEQDSFESLAGLLTNISKMTIGTSDYKEFEAYKNLLEDFQAAEKKYGN